MHETPSARLVDSAVTSTSQEEVGMHETPRARLVGYGVALLAMVAGLFFRWHLDPVLGDRALYSTFFPSVLIAAYFGGFWPGLMMTLLCAGASNYFLVEP